MCRKRRSNSLDANTNNAQMIVVVGCSAKAMEHNVIRLGEGRLLTENVTTKN